MNQFRALVNNYLLPCRHWLSRGMSGAETKAVAARHDREK